MAFSKENSPWENSTFAFVESVQEGQILDIHLNDKLVHKSCDTLVINAVLSTEGLRNTRTGESLKYEPENEMCLESEQERCEGPLGKVCS